MLIDSEIEIIKKNVEETAREHNTNEAKPVPVSLIFQLNSKLNLNLSLSKNSIERVYIFFVLLNTSKETLRLRYTLLYTTLRYYCILHFIF